LAVIALWLAPASAFGTMPFSHSCAMAPSPGGVVTSIATHADTSCQHLEQIGCLTGTCGVSAVVRPNRMTPGITPVVALEIPGVLALASGPRSAPPTPPPNN
jgi:hypothetical protein